MTLEILTPDKTIYNGEVTSVTVPGTMGFFEVLKDHAPIISTLEKGKVTIRGGHKVEEVVHIIGGVVEVQNNRIIVLAEGVEEIS